MCGERNGMEYLYTKVNVVVCLGLDDDSMEGL